MPIDSNAENPRELYWVGLDPGEARCGLAVADASGSIAFPLAVIKSQPVDTLAARFAEALGARGIQSLIVGLPLDQSGREGPSAARARAIGERLAADLNCPIVFVDERFSTRHAVARQRDLGHKGKKRRQQVDAWAAASILQTYLDNKSAANENPT